MAAEALPSRGQNPGIKVSVKPAWLRRPATQFHALVNYGYAILETEATVVLQAHGFDPGIGILHTDKRYHGSLASDLMEPLRPVLDGMVIELVRSTALARGEGVRDP
jgi:CRISPR-associated protein Cas1